jgi:kynureninase
LPRATLDRLAEVARGEWGGELIRGWDHWLRYPLEVGGRLAPLIGAEADELTLADSTTVNVYRLAIAALDARPGRSVIVTDRPNFPTDRYVLEGLAAQRGVELRLVDDLATALDGAAVVLAPHVDYRTGEIADMPGVTAAAREHGARVVWDLCHSVGAIPIDLRGSGVELAVGCTYKYLNAGPGAPAFLYVAGELQPQLRSPIWGWFGQRDQFAMERPYDPVDGIGRFQAGTPPILDLAAVESGVALTAAAGVDRLYEKATALCELIVALHDDWLEPLGFSLGSPRDPARRGSHVSVRHEEAWPICRALIERADVVPDFRGPDSVRLGIAPLYTRFVDVWDALDRLRGLVERGEQRLVDQQRSRVT